LWDICCLIVSESLPESSQLLGAGIGNWGAEAHGSLFWSPLVAGAAGERKTTKKEK